MGWRTPLLGFPFNSLFISSNGRKPALWRLWAKAIAEAAILHFHTNILLIFVYIYIYEQRDQSFIAF